MERYLCSPWTYRSPMPLIPAANGLPLLLMPGSTNMPIRRYRLLFFTGIRKKSLKSGNCGVAKWAKPASRYSRFSKQISVQDPGEHLHEIFAQLHHYTSKN
jgi:hypothetical protein